MIRSDLKSGELAELPLHLEHQVKSGTSRFKAEPEEDLSNLEEEYGYPEGTFTAR